MPTTGKNRKRRDMIRMFQQRNQSRYGSNEPPGGYYREDDPRWVSPRVIPGYGQVRNKQKPRVRRVVGNPEGIPPRTRYSYPHGPTMRTPGAVSLRRRQRKYN